MTLFEVLTVLLSLLAVVVSFVAVVRTRNTQQKLMEFEEVHFRLSQKQLAQLDKLDADQSKSKLKVRLDDEGLNSRFVVTNEGEGTATNIVFWLTGDCEHNPLVLRDFDKKCPYPSLSPGESYHLKASFPLSATQMVFQVALRWENEDRTQTSIECAVSR